MNILQPSGPNKSQSVNDSAQKQRDKQTVFQAFRNAISDLKEEIQGTRTHESNRKLKEAIDSRNPEQGAPGREDTEIFDPGQRSIRTDMADRKPSSLSEYSEESITEEFAAILSEDEIKAKKKQKKTRLEEKIDRFIALEPILANYNAVNDREKEVLSEFFDNINRFKNLRDKLKRLISFELALDEKKKTRARNSIEGG